MEALRGKPPHGATFGTNSVRTSFERSSMTRIPCARVTRDRSWVDREVAFLNLAPGPWFLAVGVVLDLLLAILIIPPTP